MTLSPSFNNPNLTLSSVIILISTMTTSNQTNHNPNRRENKKPFPAERLAALRHMTAQRRRGGGALSETLLSSGGSGQLRDSEDRGHQRPGENDHRAACH